MRYTLLAAAAFAVLARSACAATAAAAPPSAAAPADEYFGPLRMSAIGIRMRVDALGRRFHARTIADDDLVHDAGDAETAMRAWRDRYPRDPWLASAAFHLEQLYQAVQTPAARVRATAMLHYVVENFPHTPYAHSSAVRLAQGFPALHAESPVHPTPAPYASPGQSPAPEPSGNVDGASPSPSPAPTGSPTTRSDAKFPKLATGDTIVLA